MIKNWILELGINADDGLFSLLNLFDSEESFYKYFIENSIFINKEKIEKQKDEFINLIELNEKFPVRYTMKTKDHFHYKNNKVNILKAISKKSFTNKKNAKKFAEDVDLIHNTTNLRVKFDSNGNYFVKQAIENSPANFNNIMSKTNLKNFVICHIWGKTHHPLFFTSLWNVVLVPAYLSFLTDKPASHNVIIANVKLILKAICFKLYNPNILYEEIELFNEIEIDEINDGINLLKTFKSEIMVNFMSKTAS